MNPVVFGPADRQLFGLYHPPGRTPARGTGVVLCSPLGYEAMCAHRTYRHLATRLAAAGFPVLRFDYHGTGDSAGEPDEPGRVRAWLDNVGAAIEQLRAMAGVREVDLFGVRFGATLAAVAAGERSDVRSLVLWGPCTSGRSYVRELRAFRMIREQGGQPSPAPERDGDEDVAGYMFDRATVADLTAVDLLARRGRPAARALVLPRDDLPGGEKRLAAHLEACGVQTALRAEPGYAGMMRDPQDTIVPGNTLDGIVDWLQRSEDAACAEAPARTSTSSVLLTRSSASRAGVREEALFFGEQSRVFGILSEPGAGPANPDLPAVVFLNVGANHRVGPNRMYVTLARELAARGYVSFRFDVAGIGDSPVDSSACENRLYSKDSVADVKAAMTFLTRIRGVKRFVLAGVCSGAYLAFHAGMEDARVAGQIVINPQTFEWKEGDSVELSIRRSYKSTRHYMRALLDRRVWTEVLRGEVNVRGIASVLHQRFTDGAGARIRELMARSRGRPPPCTEIERAFRAMSDRGVHSLLVFSSNDGGLDMIEKHLGRNARKMKARDNFRLAIVEGADHTFTPIDARRELHQLVTRFVAGAFPPASPRDSVARAPSR